MTVEKLTAAARSEKTPADSVTDIIGSLEQWQNNCILLWGNSCKPEEIRHFHSASIRPAHSWKAEHMSHYVITVCCFSFLKGCFICPAASLHHNF